MVFISLRLSENGDVRAAVNVDEIVAFEGIEDGNGGGRLRVYLKSGADFYAYESMDDFVERLDEVVRARDEF